MGDKVKVLYIACTGRSGSTILGNILGQLDGFFHVGEIRYLWDRNILENRRCGCGLPFLECSVWNEILDEAFHNVESIEADRLIAMRNQLRSRHIPSLMIPMLSNKKKRQLTFYRDSLSKLYKAIQAKTNCRVIVDSSKFPSYGWILGTIPDLDLRVIHLVRDVRGVVYSWLHRTKERRDIQGERSTMPRFNPFSTSLRWDLWNESIEFFWKQKPNAYFHMRYEDFIDSPLVMLRSVVDFLQEDVDEFPVSEDREVILNPTHSSSGNPNRFDIGRVKLVQDNVWKSNLEYRNILLSTCLTIPWLIKYKYPIIP